MSAEQSANDGPFTSCCYNSKRLDQFPEIMKEHLRFFAQMGVTHFNIVPRQASAPATLKAVREVLGDCHRCKLSKGRIHIVFGSGNADADLMFIGEAPGADEDLQGLPFVGRAGQLLTRIIEAIGLRRDQVYIANILKCRPPGNRNPEEDEVEACEPFLLRQIEVIHPMVIMALGKYAAQTLLKTAVPITRLRGSFHDFMGIRLMPTFHPSYLLRNPSAKRDVWEDVKQVREVLRQLGSVYYR